MTQLLIVGEQIIAQGPFSMDAENIWNSDQIIPKHVIPGWELIDTSVPTAFTTSTYYWVAPSVVPIVAPEPEPVVPIAVTMRQARQYLVTITIDGMNGVSKVDSLIAAMGEPEKTQCLIEWEYSAMVERDRPLVQFLASSVGWTSEEVDEVFIQAALL